MVSNELLTGFRVPPGALLLIELILMPMADQMAFRAEKSNGLFGLTEIIVAAVEDELLV